MDGIYAAKLSTHDGIFSSFCHRITYKLYISTGNERKGSHIDNTQIRCAIHNWRFIDPIFVPW